MLEYLFYLGLFGACLVLRETLDSSNCQVSRARRAGSSAWLSREVTNLRHSMKKIYIERNLPIVTSLIRFY